MEAARARSGRHGYQFLERLPASKAWTRGGYHQCHSGRSEHNLHDKKSDEDSHIRSLETASERKIRELAHLRLHYAGKERGCAR